MRFFVVILFFLLFKANSIAGDYQVFEENGKVGLRDSNGTVVIPAAFEALGWSDGHFSMVGEVTGYKLADHWGLINLKKERITKAEFESLTHTEGDRVIVKRKVDAINAKMGCIDLRGNFTVPLKYDGIKISGLRAIVFTKVNSKFTYGLIDLNDNTIIQLNYSKIYPIGSLRYGVENFQNKTALFSEIGSQLTEFIIDSISVFNKDYAVIHQGFKQGIMDRDGMIRLSPQFGEIVIDDDGSIFTRPPHEWKVLDDANKESLRLECDQLIPSGKNYKVVTGGKFGLVDETFKSKIEVQYDYLSNFQNGKAVVRNNGKYGVIRSDNSIVLPLAYDSISMDDNFIRVKEKLLGHPSWSLYDTFAIKKTDNTYESISPYNGKFFIVKNYDHLGAVDRYGKEIIHCVYDSILEYNENQLVVKFQGLYGVIDRSGNWILTPQPHKVSLVDDYYFLEYKDELTSFRKFSGDLIYFTDNPLEVTQGILKERLPDGTEKEIDFQGIIIKRSTPPAVERAEIIAPEKEGYRAIKRDGKYGFIDARGRLRIANRYEGIKDFQEGLAAAKILGKWGYVNKEDKIVVNPSYEYASSFADSVAIVKRAGKFGLINRSGIILLELRYDTISKLPTGNFLIVLQLRQGLANKKGQVLIETRFDRLQDLGNDFLIVERYGKSGVLTLHGLSAIPMVYDQLTYLKERNQYLAFVKHELKKFNLK